jgi:hypothetical protein
LRVDRLIPDVSRFWGPDVFKRSTEHVRSEKNVPIVARSSVVSLLSVDYRNPARPGAGFTHW